MFHYMGLLCYPLANVALYGSIYVTLAVSIERFLGKSGKHLPYSQVFDRKWVHLIPGVCYPVQSRTRPRRHLLSYLIPVIFFAVVLNIPTALEIEITETQVRRF